MTFEKYTDKQRGTFLELAAEIGISRAKRELGYPKHWATGNSWAQAAGITIPLDEIKARAAAHADWYATEELMTVCQQGLSRAQESLDNDDLSPDDQKKLSEAVQKYTNTMLLLQNKATNITESRTKDGMDIGLLELYNEEMVRNATLEKEGSPGKS